MPSLQQVSAKLDGVQLSTQIADLETKAKYPIVFIDASKINSRLDPQKAYMVMSGSSDITTLTVKLNNLKIGTAMLDMSPAGTNIGSEVNLKEKKFSKVGQALAEGCTRVAIAAGQGQQIGLYAPGDSVLFHAKMGFSFDSGSQNAIVAQELAQGKKVSSQSGEMKIQPLSIQAPFGVTPRLAQLLSSNAASLR